jgi:hypothetical protein
MMKKIIEELKKQEMSVGKEIGGFEHFEIKTTVGKEEKPYKLTVNGRDATHVRIGGLEAKGTEEKILGHPISKKAPHSMLGKKLEREL